MGGGWCDRRPLFVIATVSINVALWRRHRAIAATRPIWNAETFHVALNEQGIDREVSAALLVQLRSFFMAGLTPHPSDDLKLVLQIDHDDLVDVVVSAADILGQPLLYADCPEKPPAFETVGDVASWLHKRSKRFAALDQLHSLRGSLPVGYKFDREEANARGPI